MKETIGDRIRRARTAAKLTQQALGDKVGVSRATVAQWENGDTKELKGDNLLGAANALGLDAEYLASGKGKREFIAIGKTPASPGDFAMVPLYNVKAAAGSGSVVVGEKVVDTLAFRADFLRNELNAGKDDLYLIHVEGDSMEPTLRAGDVILVDHRRQVPDREGIYVIRMEDALLVKRIQLKPGGKMVATSDNTNYKDFELSAKTPGLAIIGRVVWAGRRF